MTKEKRICGNCVHYNECEADEFFDTGFGFMSIDNDIDSFMSTDCNADFCKRYKPHPVPPVQIAKVTNSQKSD